jgi:hypothetical protein
LNQLAYVESLTPTAHEYLYRAALRLKERFFGPSRSSIRCPVTCVSCGTVYEGDQLQCQCCHDSQAFGPETHLALQVRACHDLYRHKFLS